MKALLVAIVAIAILLGFQQGRESLRLGARERELEELGKTGSSANPLEEAVAGNAGSAAPSKIGRKEQVNFDAKAYIEKFKKLIEKSMTGEPSMGDEDFLQNDLLDASVEELLLLPDQFREAGVSEEFWGGLYASISTRLLDKDPSAASELSMKGGEIENLELVMRTWISRDPQAAGEWLELKTNARPPLDEKTCGPHMSHPEPLYLPGMKFAAYIAAAPASADLGFLQELEGAKLKATLNDVLHVLPPGGLPVLLKRLSESGREDLVEMAVSQHPEPSLVREYLTEASLPPATFTKAAEAVLTGLSPGDLPRAMNWYLANTDPGLRGGGLQRIVSSWAHENPHSVAAWIEKLPDGPDRQQARQTYEETLANQRPRKERDN